MYWVQLRVDRQHGQTKRHDFKLLHSKAALIQARAGTKTKRRLQNNETSWAFYDRRLSLNTSWINFLHELQMSKVVDSSRSKLERSLQFCKLAPKGTILYEQFATTVPRYTLVCLKAHLPDWKLRKGPVRKGVRTSHFSCENYAYRVLAPKPGEGGMWLEPFPWFLRPLKKQFRWSHAQYRSFILKVGPDPKMCRVIAIYQIWSLA